MDNEFVPPGFEKSVETLRVIGFSLFHISGLTEMLVCAGFDKEKFCNFLQNLTDKPDLAFFISLNFWCYTGSCLSAVV